MPLRFLVFATVALGALWLVSTPSGAQNEPPPYEVPTPSPTPSPQPDRGTGPVTIEMRSKGRRSFFRGPKRVSRGQPLSVLNESNPQRVGPHTFTLVRRARVPQTRRQIRLCTVCSAIARAHRYHPKTGNVSRASVEAGRKGWNRAFGRSGDSWYVEKRRRSQTRRVTAPVGRRLTYFCGVHPRMWGTIRVVE